MEIIDLMERQFFPEKFTPQIIRTTPHYKVPLICMESGQEIPPHPSGTGVFYIISGKGVMCVEGKDFEVTAGTMVLVEKGESRGIKATEKLVAFAVHIS